MDLLLQVVLQFPDGGIPGIEGYVSRLENSLRFGDCGGDIYQPSYGQARDFSWQDYYF